MVNMFEVFECSLAQFQDCELERERGEKSDRDTQRGSTPARLNNACFEAGFDVVRHNRPFQETALQNPKPRVSKSQARRPT
mmetsp:Transcript_21797/g.60588  ORF Transcript_21797/g.60588 Transcript_21797/m.60588 type:complete len:81 (+) Transcript_21797:1153-1395(+)